MLIAFHIIRNSQVANSFFFFNFINCCNVLSNFLLLSILTDDHKRLM